MTALRDLKAFDVQGADVTLWTFKKQSPPNSLPQFNGHWVDTTNELNAELKKIVELQRASIEEELEYGLLAQNNETSALGISTEETHANIVLEKLAAELPARKVRNIKTLFNCAFYAIKLQSKESRLVSIRKTDSTWKSKTAKNVVAAFFNEKQLDLANDTDFKIYKNIDFFCIGGNILVRSKGNFESILNYKAAHEDDYAELIVERDFISAFTDVKELSAYVGNNKIHLRRMSAIRQKGFYRDEVFMKNLRNRYREFNLNIIFDENGCIVPTVETCRDIIAALLDHRLGSGFSGNIYDVPDATRV